MGGGALNALLVGLSASVVISVTVPPGEVWASGRGTAFNVPAQPLDAALRELARQGRVQILFQAERVQGRMSRPVQGRYEVRRAFNLALSDAGFEVRRVDERTLVVLAEPVSYTARAGPGPQRATTPELTSVLVVAPRLGIDQGSRAFDAEMSELTAVHRLSRADMDRESAQNLSEALGGLPGMTVINSGRSFIGGVDSASRGEGLYAAYRGLNAEYNLSMINGVPVAQGLPYSRGVQLNLLPPGAFETVVVHKTGRADLDGDFIGAALDFQTPRATDADGSPWTALTLGGRIESRARDYDDAGLGGAFRVEHSRRFGPGDAISVHAAVDYEDRGFTNSELGGVMAAQNDRGWAYAVSGSAEGGPVDPTRPQDDLISTSLNVGVSNGRSRIQNQTLSLDWRVDDQLDLYLQATHAKADTEQNSTFTQVVSGPQRWIDDGTGAYRLSVDSLSTRVWYETNPDVITLSTLSLGARMRSGGWRVSPYLLATRGESARPDHIEASTWIDQRDGYNTSTAPRAFNGLTVRYENGLPVPLWPQVVFDDLNNAGVTLLARRAGQMTEQFSSQDRYGVGTDVSFAPSSGDWRRLAFGFKSARSERKLTDRNWTNLFFADLYGAAGLTWEALGVAKGAYAEVFPGLYDWSVPKVDHDRLTAYFRDNQTDESFDTCGELYVNNLNCNGQSGSEVVNAVYAMATRMSGRLELQLGARYEQTRIRNTYWATPDDASGEQPGDWGHSRSRYDKLLPSLNLNYRQDDDTVWRAALWRAYSRPAFMQLGGGVRIETLNGITTVTRGNPNLKAVDAVNIDLAYHRMLAGGSALSLSGYYKHLDHYLFESGGSLDVGEAVTIDGARVVTPQNGGRGEAYGLEVEFLHAVADPLIKGGEISLQINVSRQWSNVDLGQDELGRDMPMQNAPDWLANVDAAYRWGPVSLYLSYNYTGAYLSSYNVLRADGPWDNLWVRPTSRLDARAQWRPAQGASLDLTVTNLTGEYSYWSHIGRDSLALSDVIDSGRRVVVSMRREF